MTKILMKKVSNQEATRAAMAHDLIFVKKCPYGEVEVYDQDHCVAKLMLEGDYKCFFIYSCDKKYTMKVIKNTGMEDVLNQYVNSVVFYKKDKENVSAIHLYIPKYAEEYKIINYVKS